jgi:membrane-associated protease RseP (regulator of RpoE activity)
MPPRPDPKPLGRFERVTLVVFLGALATGFGVELARDFTPGKASVLFFLAARLPLTAIHEGGHALAARALGFHVRRVVIGYGGAFWRFHVRGVPVQFGRVPLGGHVRFDAGGAPVARGRAALVYAAGVGAELVVLAAVVAAVGTDAMLARSHAYGVIAAQALAVAVLLDVIANWIPAPARRDEISHRWSPNDGLGIVLCLFGRADPER